MNADLVDVNAKLMRAASVDDQSNMRSCCVARPAPVREMREPSLRDGGENTLDVVRANVAYLENARLVSRDILSGSAFLLADYRFTMGHAEFFATRTNDDIRMLASRWSGLIAKPIPDAVKTEITSHAACLFHQVLRPTAN